MPRSELLLIGVAVAAVVAVAAAHPAARGPAGMAAAGAPVVLGAPADDVPDPFPIARLRVSDAQLPDAAKAFAPGPLTRLSRPTFEAKVRAAGEAVLAAKAVPHVVEARYTAAPAGAALAGTAEWTITHHGRGPAVLPLDPLKAALRDATWADGSPAAVGAFAELPAGAVGVWVPGPGRHVLRAKWTAAGTGPAAERAFDLRFPPCPASALDLDLPADRTPTAAADVLVTGPLPGAAAGRNQWRVRFGEKARAELTVRAPVVAGGGPVVFSAAARYDLAPGEVVCEFDLDLRAVREPAAEWAFALSAGLRVTDVTVNNRAGWRVDPATRELRVTLRQPAAAAKVRVTAAAPLSIDPTPLPTVRPVNGLAAEERAEIHVPPRLDLAGWDPGDFRLADAATAADGSRLLVLAGTLLPPEARSPIRRPPTVRAADAGPVFATAEAVTWEVEAGRARLAMRVTVRVRRGPLFRVAVRPPPGFALVRAATTPADLLAFTGSGQAGAVVVDLARPLTAGQDAELVLEFRGQPLPPGPVARLPFPAVGVVGAAERDGTVTLDPGPAWEAFPHLPPELPGLPDDPADGPLAVRYRGPEPVGELVLSAIRPAFAAAADTRFEFADGRLTAITTVRLDVTAGLVGGVALFDPRPAEGKRAWKVTDGSNTVATAAPVRLGELPAALTLLGRLTDGLGSLAATAAAARAEPGTFWLVRFSRPVDDDLALETTTVLGTGLTHAEAARRAAAWGGPVVRGAASRTAHTDLPPALGGGPGRRADAPREWVVGELLLSTTCEEHDQHATLRGVVTGRGGGELPVALPAGTVVRSAAVGGRAVDPASLTGAELRLPVPAGDDPVRFEVRYRLRREVHSLAWTVASPVPEVTGATGEPRREWVFAPGVAAAWPYTVRPTAGSAADDGTRADFPGDTVTVLPHRPAVAAGVGLAGLVAGLGWVGARWASRSAGFALLTLVLGGGVAAAAGPPAWERAAWPVLAVGLPAAAAVVVARGRFRRPAAGAAAVFLAAAVATGQTVSPDVVFVVTGPAGEVVLAPPALLARLDALAKPAAPVPVVVAAGYDGKVEDGLARFTATFAVQAFGPGEQTVQLPLADVRLERVAVGGMAANPVASGPGRYAVPLPGPGRHPVEVRFVVPVAAAGGEREVKLGVPEVPDSRLTFAAPPGARQVQAVGRLGEQRTTDPTRIEADLGAVKAVAVRWREGPGGAGRLTVREGCVWDVSESGAVLTACYDVRAESGTAATFRFDLPADLEPVRVAARGLDPAAAPVAVQSWTVGAGKDGARPLRIDLAAPADGRVLVTIECHTRSGPTRRPVLRFPRTVGMERLGGVYGLRPAPKMAVEKVDRPGMIDYPPDVLLREFGAVPELRLAPGGGLQAFSPQPGTATAELRPVLRPSHDAGVARVEASWATDLRRAVGGGTVAWAATEPAALLEFTLAAKVREVRAADLAGWAQTGDRVQVWFRRPVAAAAVEWTAEVTHPTRADTVAFEPPAPRPVAAATGPAVVRVRPADGVGLRVERETGWTPDPPGGGREWAFRAAGGVPPVRVQLAATRIGPATGFGLLDLSAREPSYRVALDLPTAAGRPAHAAVRLTGMPHAAGTLETPPGVRVAAREGGSAWDLDVPNPTGPLRVVVAVRLPAGWTGPLQAVWAGPGGDALHPNDVVRIIGRVGRPDVQLSGTTATGTIERAEAGALWPGEVERLRRTGGELLAVGTSPVEAAVAAPSPAAVPTPPPAALTVPAPSTAAGPPPGTGEAAAWLLTLLAVGVLFARVPRATWPEQVAILVALLGHAAAATPLVGVAAYLVARGVWVADRFRAHRHRSGE